MALRIRILAVGKFKASHLSAGVADYRSRLRHYAKIDVEEVPAGVPRGARLTPEKKMVLEAKGLSKALRNDEYVIALDRNGAARSSQEWASSLQHLMNRSRSKLAFVIGGEEGLARQFLAEADETWSLSQLTFPHDMVQLILLEQLYRALSILAGEKYHR